MKNTDGARPAAKTACLLALTLASQCAGVASAEPRPERKSTSLSATQSENPSATVTPTLSLEQRADLFMARKEFADAIEFYQRALKQPGLLDPAQATLWNKLGIAYEQRLSYNGARRAYKMAIRRRKDFAEPWNNLASTYFFQNKFAKSVKYYQHAIRLSPNSASFHMNLGSSYYRIKKFKEAVDEYYAALVLDPDILAEHSSQGTVLETRVADADYFFYLAKSFAKLGRIEEAVHYLRRAFEDGFKDRKRLDEDPDFQKISQSPAYVELMKNLPYPIND